MKAGPSWVQAWAELAGGVLLLAAALPAAPLGRVLLVPGGLLLLALGARDALLRPVLEADSAGVRVVSGLRRQDLTWEQLVGARVVTDRRAPLLELDLGETLVVLSRARLGAAPWQVLEELVAARP